jgi:hypothetical protein
VVLVEVVLVEVVLVEVVLVEQSTKLHKDQAVAVSTAIVPAIRQLEGRGHDAPTSPPATSASCTAAGTASCTAASTASCTAAGTAAQAVDEIVQATKIKKEASHLVGRW